MLICMCGVAGSGKSTKAKELARHYGCKIVSTDAIRKELFGDEAIQKDPYKVFQIAYERVAKYLESDGRVIFDAMNLRKRDRKKILKVAREHDKGIAVIYAATCSLEDVLRQNKLRKRQVPEEVITSQFLRYEMPTLEEGWTDIRKF